MPLILAADPSAIRTQAYRKYSLAFLIGSIVVISALAGVYVFGARPAQSKTSPTLSVNAQVSIKVYAGSTLEQSVTQDHDMVMNNFMNFLGSWLTYEGATSASSTFTMTDTTGTVHTLIGRDSSTTIASCSWSCEISTAPYAGGYIAVGTGSAAPTRTDFKLGTQYQTLVPVTAPTYDPSTGDINFGVSILAGAAATICEVGFFENWYVGGLSWANFLIFHDSLVSSPSACSTSGIAVTPGNTISVQYTVQLGSTAYNNNLGTLLAAIFANPLGTTSSVKLTPTTGAAQTVYVYELAAQACCNLNYYTNPFNSVYLRADLGSGTTGADSTIEAGTGSTATCPGNTAAGFTQSRSAINLCNPVLSYQPVNSFVFSPYVAVTAIIPTPTAQSFTEAGYFQSFGSSSFSFLLIRNTFSALAVPADSSITTTYELSMS